jgi:DNA-binding response OmpR family regulator
MRPLAIIEQDSTTAVNLRRSIEAAGFRTDCFADGASALTSIRSRGFSLAILDLDLRDTDPFAVCREVSRIVPVITITAEQDEDVRVRAFEAGADDCVANTLTGRELVARVRNVLRRAANAADETTCDFEALTISLAEMRIRNGTAVHELSRGETEVLSLLLERSPAPITAIEMARILPAKRATIESRIKSLRKKLGRDRLVTRGRFGYELRMR